MEIVFVAAVWVLALVQLWASRWLAEVLLDARFDPGSGVCAGMPARPA